MSSVMFYRYENEEGYGPYCAYVISPIPIWATPRWPMPKDLPWHGNTIRFGFTTYKALCKWFTPQEKATLKACGWKLVKKLVPAEAIIYNDGKQACVKLHAWETANV